jgi:hypothetical protein
MRAAFRNHAALEGGVWVGPISRDGARRIS